LLAPLLDIPLPLERSLELMPEELRRRQLAAVTNLVIAGARTQPIVLAVNHIDVEVVDELTDADFDRLGVSIGHRRKLLKALAAGVSTAAELPLGNTIIESAERPQIIVGSTSSSVRKGPEDLRDASPVPSRLGSGR
jgi:SAM domain (Sterile alpha motif)